MSLNYSMIAAAAVVLFVVYMIMWIFVKPIKYLLRSAVSGAVGTALLYFCNFLTGAAGFAAGVNVYTALVCAFLGIPGFLMVLAMNMFMR